MNASGSSAGGAAQRTPGRSAGRRRAVLLISGVLLIGGVWVFRRPLQEGIRERAVLANEAPSAEVVAETIEESSNPARTLLRAWDSGKIVHRQVAIRSLGRVFPRGQALPGEFESLLLSAALDPDLNVREAALALLDERKDPALAVMTAEQLRDVDPQVRMLGMNYVKRVDRAIAIPMVKPLLDDSDPVIVTLVLKLLEGWTGKQFGVRLSETAAVPNEKTGIMEYRDGSAEKAKAGAELAKGWYARHDKEYPAHELKVPEEGLAALQRIPAGDFELNGLDGKRVKLSDFRGKTVLINFWTTWCTACVSEMPELIELQKNAAGKVAILGVSLDYVPDSHGHIGGHAAVEEQNRSEGHHDDRELTEAAFKRVRENVARTAKLRGVNYPVLLDEKNEVGGKFNGGELPTTLVVDREGYVRRRFVGARTLAVFQAMVAEAEQPVKGRGL